MYYRKTVSNSGMKVYQSISDEEAEKLMALGEEVVSEDELNTKERKKSNSSERKTDSGANIVRMLPFLDDEAISLLVDEMINGHWDKPFHESEVYPFASDDDMDRLFWHKMSNSDKSIVEIAPFVSDETLAKGVDMVIEGKYELSTFDSLYPFLDAKDVKRLFEYALKTKQDMQ